MNTIDRVAVFMRENGLTLVTAESCTAGMIASMLADVPGAGALLDCAFVVYSPDAKRRCVGVSQRTLDTHNLTSEAVAREMALGAAQRSPANVAIANTGLADGTDDEIPAGTQCFAWVFKLSAADATPAVYTETRRFDGGRHGIRKAAAAYALERMITLHQEWRRHGGR
ncbi:CinA family protein [Bordetella genomosp. 9]|uniref:Ompetence-damaged protein n=1 Tax=Bordetella genomosp. 9 TaxID=1416803 RepID=A0A1W6YYI9_9BORD|nr:CinA family protein [Bordetella genomosp. 9]ARP86014.1 ompetence-damaged protein [Bordetella genomosp. 9]ARP90035.1 ompetence-damaged protein [Bordetella genomosp. 9]